MLLPFQGARWLGYYKPRVSAHVVRLALGYVLLAFQAVIPQRSLPPPESLEPNTLCIIPNGRTSGASASCEICVICVKILFCVRQNHQRDKIHKIPRELTKNSPAREWGRGVV